MSLEHLINNAEDLTYFNKHSVIHHAGTTIKSPIKQSRRLRASGNAQIMDFIDMVGMIVENYFDEEEVEYLPSAKCYLIKEDADQQILHPIISFKVESGRHPKGYSLHPQLVEEIIDEEGRTGEIYTEQFGYMVRFQFLSLDYREADTLMEEFKDLLLMYKKQILSKGIVKYYLHERLADQFTDDFRQDINVLSLVYYVETQKNRVIFSQGIKNIFTHGEIVEEDGQPIPTNPAYLKANQ